MRRYGGVISISADVDMDEVLSELSDAELIEELRRRKKDDFLNREFLGPVHDAYDALMRSRPTEALGYLDRLLFPKFKNVEACQKQYEQARLALS